jgi:hypothetical protein
MEFIRRFIEEKISRATGQAVRFGKVSFSPMSGGVEVRDLSVGTFLTVRKIEAKIAVARALKQEIVLRSLAIEEPVVTIVRGVDGKSNLPARPESIEKSGGGDGGKAWEFEAQKVLLVGGRIAVEDASGYRISLENICGSVEMKSAREAEFLFAADSLGRRDVAVELGEARLLGKVAGTIEVTVICGAMLDLNLRSPGIESGKLEGELNLAMALTTLLALLPANVRLPIATASGEARLSAAGSFDRTSGKFEMQRFELKTGVVTVPLGAVII